MTKAMNKIMAAIEKNNVAIIDRRSMIAAQKLRDMRLVTITKWETATGYWKVESGISQYS